MSESAIADEIGRIGEAFFDFIMTSTDLLVGKIEPDRLGKDRVIETKLSSRDENVSFDERAAPLSCSVQIKTILPTTDEFSLSLSVAERLVQSSLPCFIYVVQLDEAREVEEIRVLHILGEHLERILKRLRKEFAKGTETLNDRKITFAFTAAEAIGNKGADLKAYIQNEIGTDLDAYVERKTHQRKNLGYEPGRPVKISGSFETENISDFVDGLLGLKALPVGAFRVEEERFGIALPSKSFPSNPEGAIVTVTPQPVSRASIMLGEQGSDGFVEIDGDVIFPAGVEFLPVEHFKILLRSPFLEAIFTRENVQMRSIPEWAVGQSRSLAEWIPYVQMLLAFSKPSCAISFRGPEGIEPLGIIEIDNTTDEADIEYLLKLLRALQRVRKEANAEDHPVSIEDVYAARPEIFKALHTIDGRFDYNFRFNVPNPAMDLPEELEFLNITAFAIGSHHYAYGVRCRAKSEKIDAGWHISQTEPFSWVDITPVADQEASLTSYGQKLMRLGRADLCLISFQQEEEVEVINLVTDQPSAK